MITQVPQVRQVAHGIGTAGDPAGLSLALAVAAELHTPLTRAPEVASAARAAARRNTAARPHRRTVRG